MPLALKLTKSLVYCNHCVLFDCSLCSGLFRTTTQILKAWKDEVEDKLLIVSEAFGKQVREWRHRIPPRETQKAERIKSPFYRLPAFRNKFPFHRNLSAMQSKEMNTTVSNISKYVMNYMMVDRYYAGQNCRSVYLRFQMISE